MITIPNFLFALLVSALCGSLYHLLRGGDGWRLFLYLALSALGFAAGQAFSVWRGWNLFAFGALDIGVGAIGSVIFLTFGEWLGKTKKESGV
jgi:hypothetical protein